MANTLTTVAPILLQAGLETLRQNAVMAKLVNRNYEAIAVEPGTPIRVVIPSPMSAYNVTAGNETTVNDLSPEAVNITVETWKGSPFTLSDLELSHVSPGLIPMQVQEAAKALANAVDASLIGLYKKVYGYSGVAGTTPSSVSDFANLSKVLHDQLCPRDRRALVVDTAAEAKLLQNDVLTEMQSVGTGEALIYGQLSKRMGFDPIIANQNLSTYGYHTAGTLGQHSNKTATINGAVSAGATTLNLDGSTAGKTIVEGDIFTVAGVAGSFVVTNTSVVTLDGSGATTGLTFSPKAPAGGFADNAVVTFLNSHQVNLAFHPNAFALVVRKFPEVSPGLGSLVDQTTDPVSGLSLRLEITRKNNLTRYEFQILYGVAVLRPELAARLLG